ncbi:MAG: hypothetical protein A2Z04_08545 [Chloroflexi bacterium RBG_16_57_9]|nr:MAG: hypothetical protein A2Z04_08545 [Chloroflexi bacterium RBG_16_57_9]
MPTPFPGMDPYLERRGLWEGVHTRLIVAMADALNPLLRPRYRAEIELRTYLAVLTPDEFVGIPDVLVIESGPGLSPTFASLAPASVGPKVAELPMPEEVHERYLEVRDVTTDEVITVIELLSPTNKISFEGRRRHKEKRLQVLASATHLIEIDLLRRGDPMPMRIPDDGHRGLYRILVSRANRRPHADVYVFGVREPIPSFPVPLRRGEPEPVVDLNTLLHDLYDRASYDLAIDYHQPPDPALNPEDAAWADELLRK